MMRSVDFETLQILEKLCKEMEYLASVARLAWMHSLPIQNQITIRVLANLADKSEEIFGTLSELVKEQEELS